MLKSVPHVISSGLCGAALGFQHKLEEQRELQQQQQQQHMPAPLPMAVAVAVASSPPSRGPKKSAAAAADADANRKSYKCGRCGQPKVGHVCTMPELRNNWAQVDLEVTKGLKAARSNCLVVAVKAAWMPQHPDHV
ncbi:hypothetical protein P43SY_005059 [Pythium insidiosum]|uniref:Uncharacterized protein n=1 Tax=Pythium insidiosum TaxID=114742 RepID=A0AAD5QB28_PYTIN|nr:hypothetical protein P43SY_005059 [Pythium insidiosum]